MATKTFTLDQLGTILTSFTNTLPMKITGYQKCDSSKPASAINQSLILQYGIGNLGRDIGYKIIGIETYDIVNADSWESVVFISGDGQETTISDIYMPIEIPLI